MQIIIEIKNKVIRLILKDQEKLIDEIEFNQEENISQKLLPFFDELLKKNELTKEDISKVEVDTDLGDTYTSRRIAEAFANSFNAFKKSPK
ncbi:MAG: hypothetical protein WAV31_05960 [Candidatus Moraniibacteriota bacterium]